MMKESSSVSHGAFVQGVDGLTPSFALRPLSTTLVSERGVEIRMLDPETGTWGASEFHDFQDIDLEVWARAWLEDMDRICAGPYAVPAQVIAPDALDRLQVARRQLACAVANGLSPILAVREAADDKIGSPAWKAARGALHQRLLAQLAAAYDTATVFQCNAAVSFPLDVSQTARHRVLALESVDSQSLHATLLADPAIASIPVPLRLYPAAPTLISQTSETQHAHPETIADALLWAYSFTCSHRSAAQDQMLLTIEFNRPPLARKDFHVEDGAPLRARDEGDSLFKALAQYVSISDALWKILAGLPNPDADKALLANALDAYADLAEGVAGLWSDWWGVGGCDDTPATIEPAHPAQHRLAGHSHHATAPATLRAAAAVSAPAGGARHESYRYLATLDAAPVDGVDLHVTLTLKLLDADGTAAWPEIAVILEDGRELPLAPDAPEKDTRAYRFPAGDDATRVPASTVPGFRYRIANLPIPDYQNAHAAVSVIRNAQLLGAEGPEISPALVYRTPQVQFPNPMVPYIIVGTRLDIGAWTSAAKTNPLTAVFDQLFGDDPVARDMVVDIRYAYPVAGSEAPMDISVPVALLPRFPYQPSSTVQSIIDALDLWAQRERPETAGGLWILRITLYSGIDASHELPLLELQSVISPLP